MERLGVSVRNVLEARKAQSDGADYLGVGAMFSTRTKPDASVISMEELLKIRQAVSVIREERYFFPVVGTCGCE